MTGSSATQQVEEPPAQLLSENKSASSTEASPAVGNGNLFDEAIRLRAYEKWEAAGKPVGDGVSYWLEAEEELHHAE